MSYTSTPPLEILRAYGDDGIAYGEGTGTALGPRLAGTLRWHNYPRLRGDGVLCPDVRGFLETDDGAKIVFTMQGYALEVGVSGRRAATTSLLFTTDEPEYAWLNSAYAVAEAAVDYRTSALRVRAYLCKNELAAELAVE